MVLLLALLASAWAQDPAPPEPESPAPTTEEPAPASSDEGSATEEPAPRLPAWQRRHWGWGGLPALNYNTDEGFGFGLLGELFWYDGKTAPYKSKFALLLFMTTKAVHSHRFDFDLLEVGGAPLRLQGRIMFDATKTANFCGYGYEVTCDPQVAEDAADAQGLTGDEREDFVRRYYRIRFVRPYVNLIARYRVYDGPPKIEVFAGWRGEMFLPGDFQEAEPYPGSLYDTTIGAEKGFMSVFQAGANLDTRDNEPAPRRGHWHEVSIRGAAPWTGSAWSYFGFNTTLRFYAPLAPNGRLTLASRTVFDGIVGDVHVREMAFPGGLRGTFYSMGGGDGAGRGIRLRRYVGRVKGLEQMELRWAFARFNVGKAGWELTGLVFADVLVAGEHWSDIGPAFAHPKIGEGVGLRIAINESFVLRGDVGFSHIEHWSPGIYLDVEHLF